MLTCEENNKAIERIIEVGYQQWYKETHPNYLEEEPISSTFEEVQKNLEEWRKKRTDI